MSFAALRRHLANLNEISLYELDLLSENRSDDLQPF